MRTPLYAKQKKLLNRWYVELGGSKVWHHDITYDQFLELKAIRNTETLWADANRYLDDMAFADCMERDRW